MTSRRVRPGGACVDDCGEGFFVDRETRDCEPCHTACRTCGGPRYEDCDSCRDGLKLRDGERVERRQLSVCHEKSFLTGMSNTSLFSERFSKRMDALSSLASDAFALSFCRGGDL